MRVALMGGRSCYKRGFATKTTMEKAEERRKTALITGANTGIGKETARQLMAAGYRILLACRDPQRGKAAVVDLKKRSGKVTDPTQLEVIVLDLSSLRSVRTCAEGLKQRGEEIHVLINNAGVMACPFSLTEDSLETQFGVNHVAHFLFTSLLLPVLINSAPARVVTLSSHAHYAGNIDYGNLNGEKKYDPFRAYAQSKLANVLFSKELARRLKGSGVTTYCVHPGLVATELGRHMSGGGEDKGKTKKKSLARRLIASLSKTSEEGARTSVYCASHPGLVTHSGFYYSNCRRVLTSPRAWGLRPGKTLWQHTEKIVHKFL